MQVPYYIDLLGVLIFAISGALAVYGKEMYNDIFDGSFTALLLPLRRYA